MAATDPGRTAYGARFADARPRAFDPWDSLTPEVKAIWARVEAASRAAGATAMREECARWHEAQAQEYDREARDRTLPDGSWAGRDAMWARADALAQREYAPAIQALSAATLKEREG